MTTQELQTFAQRVLAQVAAREVRLRRIRERAEMRGAN